eukprot:COSAG05_NODE_13614_length_423_cov_1.339506_1_plen_67_part_01
MLINRCRFHSRWSVNDPGLYCLANVDSLPQGLQLDLLTRLEASLRLENKSFHLVLVCTNPQNRFSDS